MRSEIEDRSAGSSNVVLACCIAALSLLIPTPWALGEEAHEPDISMRAPYEASHTATSGCSIPAVYVSTNPSSYRSIDTQPPCRTNALANRETGLVELDLSASEAKACGFNPSECWGWHVTGTARLQHSHELTTPADQVDYRVTLRLVSGEAVAQAFRTWASSYVDLFATAEHERCTTCKTSASVRIVGTFDGDATRRIGEEIQLEMSLRNGSLPVPRGKITLTFGLEGAAGFAEAEPICMGRWPFEICEYDYAATATAHASGVLEEVIGSVVPSADEDPPDTTISANPTDPQSQRHARFSFESTENASRFECVVNGSFGDPGAEISVCGPSGYSWETGPYTKTGGTDLGLLSPGVHTLEVRAVDLADNVDPLPAKYQWTVPQWAPNDDFDNAEELANVATSHESGELIGENTFATRQPGEPEHFWQKKGGSVWYRWTAPTNDRYVLIVDTESRFDSLLSVYRGSTVAGLTRVAEDGLAPSYNSRLVFDAEQGVTYSIAVDGRYVESGGRFRFLWSPLHAAAPPKPPPPTLEAASDSGASNSDGVTQGNRYLTFAGHVGKSEPGFRVHLYRNGTWVTYFNASHDGTYRRSLWLAEGINEIQVKVFDPYGHASELSDPLRIVVDTVAPAEPTLDDVDPDSPGTDQTPLVIGVAERDAFVMLFTDTGCIAPSVGGRSNAAGQFAIEATVDPGSTTTFRAIATDLAGNSSRCSIDSVTYTHEQTDSSPAPSGSPSESPSPTPTPSPSAT